MERLADTIIVPAGPGDAAGIARVHVQSWRETYAGLLPADYLANLSAPLHARRWRQRLGRPRAGDLALIAEGPDGVIGYCAGALATGSPCAEVHTLYLLGQAQGHGLGRRLLESAARVFESEGAESLGLWVLGGNRKAARFYAHLGGTAAGERPVLGWGGGRSEYRYVWNDIGALTRR